SVYAMKMSWLFRYRCTCPLVGVMSAVVTLVTTPPVTDTLTSTEVPCTTSPLMGATNVMFTGVDGRWPRPPDGVGYCVGAGVGEPPSADAGAHAVTPRSTVVRS